MEKTEQMYRFEQETGLEALVTVPLEGDSLLVVSEEYARWVETELQIETIRANALQNAFDRCEAKAAAYNRLMSGEYTLKDMSNIFQMYSAIDADGYARLFADPPFIDRVGWSSNFPEDEFSIPGGVKHTGDWKDSVTLPDGWEVTHAN